MINPENIKPTYSQIGWEYKTINISELLYSECHLDEESSYEDTSDNI
tara:strand:+ start:177 stop:317 length:141 start_codon:yes stop_codon:yes gene_type:complete